MRTARAPAPGTAQGGLHHESYKPSGTNVRVGPAPLAHRALLRRGMRCVQWLAKRQRERTDILQPAPFTSQNPALKR
jgi:hypothetical protein